MHPGGARRRAWHSKQDGADDCQVRASRLPRVEPSENSRNEVVGFRELTARVQSWGRLLRVTALA